MLALSKFLEGETRMIESKKKAQPMKGQQTRIEKRIPIEWYFPEGQRGIFANHMLVQFDKHEYQVSFFELPPPIVIGEPEMMQDQIDQLKKVRATCVARIIISAERMPSFVKALQDNLDRQKKLQAPLEEEPRR